MKNNTRLLVYSIVGVLALIAVVAGAAFAYYQASVSNNNTVTGTAAGATTATLTITKESSSATGNLIPLDNDTTTLTKATKGYNNTGTTFDATKSCKDKNGYSVCQVYSVIVNNTGTVPAAYTINLTSLAGTSTPNNTPNIAAANVGSDGFTVSANTPIIGSKICDTGSVAAGGSSSKCYFMVYIKNLTSAQTDSGTFKGTITATSTVGNGQIKAAFS